MTTQNEWERIQFEQEADLDNENVFDDATLTDHKLTPAEEEAFLLSLFLAAGRFLDK